jgi:hypothetical protein
VQPPGQEPTPGIVVVVVVVELVVVVVVVVVGLVVVVELVVVVVVVLVVGLVVVPELELVLVELLDEELVVRVTPLLDEDALLLDVGPPPDVVAPKPSVSRPPVCSPQATPRMMLTTTSPATRERRALYTSA